MKKMYTLVALTFLIATSNAQSFTQIWRKTAQAGASDLAWFNNTSASVRSLTYNPVTNKLYVALTSGTATGDSIFIINSATGVVEGTLRRDGLGIGSEPFKNLRVRASDDGAIYSSSLSVVDASNSSIQRCKVYRWASHADTATLACSFTTTERCGDALGISGTGVDTKIYVAGINYARDNGVIDSTAQKIYILTTTNGVNFTKTDSIRLISTKTVGANPWIRSLDPIGSNITDGFWVNNIGRSVSRLAVVGSAGAYTASVDLAIVSGNGNNQASSAYASVKYLQTPGNKKYIAMAGAWFSGITATTNTGVVMRMMDVTDEVNNLKTVGTDTLRGVNNTDTLLKYSTNTTTYGDVAFKNNGDGSYDVFYLSTNNGFACTRSATTLPVSLNKFAAKLANSNIVLAWETSNEINNAGFEIQKSVNGVNFSKIGFVAAKSNAANKYEFTDANGGNTKSSTVYYRLKQLDKDGQFAYSKVEVVNLPLLQQFAVSTIENPVKNEIKLVVSSTKESNITLSVKNSIGQIFDTKKYSVRQGNNTIVLPSTQLNSGIYYITISNGEFNQTINVVKN